MQQAFINLENWIKENNQAGIKMDSVFLSHLEKGIQLKKSNWIPETIQNTYLKEFEIIEGYRKSPSSATKSQVQAIINNK